MNQTMPVLNENESNLLLSALRTRGGSGNETVKGLRNHLIALLMLDAGLRVGETVSLRVSDLFIMGEPVGIIRVLTEKRKRTKPGANPEVISRVTRDIPVTIRLNDAIEEYAARKWVPRRYCSNYYAFCLEITSNHITPRQVERFIRKAALASLHRCVHPHILRHTFATRLMTKCSIRVVQQLLGHASIQSTQVYTHPNSTDLQTAIDALNGPCEENGGKPVSKPVTSG